MAVIPAAFSARRRDERRLDALRRVLRQRAPNPERLIVRMREDGEQAPAQGMVPDSAAASGSTNPMSACSNRVLQALLIGS